MEASLQEWNLQKEKKGALLGAVGSIEAQKRLKLKNKRQNQIMKRNIGKHKLLSFTISSHAL